MTLHNLTITATENKEKNSDIPKIDYVISAKTYRYEGNTESAAKAADSASTQEAPK